MSKVHEIDLTGLTPTQSSTCCGGVPERAVDGDTNDDYGKGSCTHTETSTDPWWRVQLPGRHMITEVVLYNRSTNRGRLSPVYVYVQESRPSIDILCGSYTNSYMAMLNFTCPALLKGDVLWVEVRVTYKVLTICEVKVYGWEL